jgi:DNA-binding NarL/FixJ family response regulator
MRPIPPRSPIKVAVVEDHPEFREALCKTLSEFPSLQLMEICRDLPAGLRLVERECPDVLLVDLGLPSGSGLTLIRAAHLRWGKRCTSAVLTVTGNEEHLLTAVGVGAKGYLFKSDQAGEWCQTVQTLSLGQSPLHANLAQRFLQLITTVSGNDRKKTIADGAVPPIILDTQTHALLLHIAAGYTWTEASEKLTLTVEQAGSRLRSVYDQFMQRGPELSRRELELLQLLDKGFTFKKCAELMSVSETTTKTQATRAYQKLGAPNLQTALYEARVAGLLP